MRRRLRRVGLRRVAPLRAVAGTGVLACILAAAVAVANADATGNSGTTGVAGVTGATGVPGVTGVTGAAGVAPVTACTPGPVPATTTTTTTTSTTTTTTTTTSTTTTTLPGSTTTTLPGATTTTAPSQTTTSVAPTTTTIAGSTTTTTVPVTPPQIAPSYYLFTNAGGVSAFGSALAYGSKAGGHLSGVVGGSATVDGGGYWFATAHGGVYNFGDAQSFGSAIHVKLRKPIVAMAATPDSEGYWLVGASGAVYNFGDAPSCGSAIHRRLARPVTGIVPTADGAGYWLLCAGGEIIPFGDAGTYGTQMLQSKKVSMVGMVRTPDGLGYWLAASNGGVYNFGDATYYGSAVHLRLSAPVVSIGASPSGHGYWLALANGRVYNYGDAPFEGSLAHRAPKKPIRVVAIIPTVAVVSAAKSSIPHHLFGYDVSNYQCAKQGSASIKSTLPGSSSLTIIEVAGLLDSANNSCLSSLAAWANRVRGGSGTPYELYLFTNAPGTNAGAGSIYANGPRGVCNGQNGNAKSVCIAYNYGYNGAKDAYAYATGLGVRSSIWWLDVEGTSLSKTMFSDLSKGIYWGANPALNAQTVQGALDALHQEGLTVGLYSTSVQWPVITGGLVPVGAVVPLWIAGVPLTNPPYNANYSSPSILTTWCAGTAKYRAPSPANDLFAGGVPWLLQETPGTAASPYGLDPNYSC